MDSPDGVLWPPACSAVLKEWVPYQVRSQFLRFPMAPGLPTSSLALPGLCVSTHSCPLGAGPALLLLGPAATLDPGLGLAAAALPAGPAECCVEVASYLLHMVSVQLVGSQDAGRWGWLTCRRCSWRQLQLTPWTYICQKMHLSAQSGWPLMLRSQYTEY